MEDLINEPRVQEEPASPPKRGRWLKRFLFAGLLFFVACCCLFFWFVHTTRSKAPYSTALELILNDAQLTEALGEPIRDKRWLPTSGYPGQFQMQAA